MNEVISLDKPPIVEAVIEIRFDNKINYDLMIGQMCGELEIDKVEELPILSLPPQFRHSEESFIFSPYHRIIYNDNVSILVGPNVFTFSNTNKYIGWDEYSRIINEILPKVVDKFFGKIRRVGLRYINNIADCDFSRVNVDVMQNSNNISNVLRLLSFAIVNKEPISKFNNSVSNINILFTLNYAGNVETKNTVIDIDNIIEMPDAVTLEELIISVSVLHDINKKHFFSFLKEDLVNSMGPVFKEK